jgi:hypothetical protein
LVDAIEGNSITLDGFHQETLGAFPLIQHLILIRIV